MLNKILLQIAKNAILNNFDAKYAVNTEAILKKYPELAKKGAAFVTLTYNKDLRGCIGSIIPHRTLLDDIIHNAKSAAFHDPRFKALGIDEFENINLEVSVLSQAQILDYNDYNDLLSKICPKIDGVILKHQNFQGTFLPQVWEQLPSASLFLEHLSYKAGTTPDVYKQHPEIYTYQVEHIEESFNEILPL